MMPLRATVLAVGLGVSLMACGASDEEAQDCSVAGQNRFVYGLMRDVYLWADSTPELDPAALDSPAAVLDAMAYSRDRWSGIQAAAQRTQYYEEARYVGLGLQLVGGGERQLRVGLIYANSPAERAGLRRGMTVVGINGISVDEIDREALWATVDGPDEPGVVVSYEVRDRDASTRVVPVEKDWVDIQTVLRSDVVWNGDKRIGYLLFTSFLGTAAEELRDAFATFKNEGIDELVLDLRYNGGGLLSAASVLASLISGSEAAGQPLSVLEFNPRHASSNNRLELRSEENGLGLSRLVVLSGAGTASASELLVNGLRPYMPVELVGGTTHGKPVGANTWEYCGLAVTPITFRVLNAEGQGDYFEGLKPRCAVPDDLDHELGSPDEARMNAALSLLANGTCGIEPRRLPDLRDMARERLVSKWPEPRPM
jgi:C-terminal peptidase prc